MATLSYSVTSTNPISIYPAGQQGEVTVFNNSANRVMIASDAGGLIGIPLDGGNSIKWDAATPLYAFITDTAKPATVYVIDSGVTLPSTNVTATIPGSVTTTVTNTVGVTGAVSANANADLLYNSGFGTPATLFNGLAISTAPYNTIILNLSQNSPLAGDNWGHLNITWTNAAGTTVATDSLFVEISATYSQVGAQHTWTLPVKGTRMVLNWSNVFGSFNSSNNFTLFGTTAMRKMSYAYNGYTNNNFTPQGDIGPFDFWGAQGAVPGGGGFQDGIPVINGPAKLWLYSVAAATVTIRQGPLNSTNAFGINIPATTHSTYDILLPMRPCVIQFNVSGASTCYYGITYTEPY